jgi:hypothetical protein
MTVIDERAEDNRHIHVGGLAARPDHVMTVSREDRCNVGQLHARNIEKAALELTNNAGHPGKRKKTGAIPADDGVL